MKEELLQELREALEKEKLKIDNHNKLVKRIMELEKDSKVKEYLELTNLGGFDLKLVEKSDKEIIISLYRHYLRKIEKNETNGIFVYLGTYQRSSETDIVHGGHDIRLSYDNPYAEFREYWDIEYAFGKTIPISRCGEFEKNHIVINPVTYLKEVAYYDIQEEFFTEAIKNNQESAKKMILEKYKRLGK